VDCVLVVAESVLVRHQLLVLNRGRKRAPSRRTGDRIIAGLCTLFMRPARVLRSAIVLKPSTLLHLHSLLRQRKYRMLFSSGQRHRPGPKGPKQALIDAIVAMKRRRYAFCSPRQYRKCHKLLLLSAPIQRLSASIDIENSPNSNHIVT
jgi:putative transposase